MALTRGTRFGPYEITGPIGAGGMGEVYRATDTKLGREVAIKTLPSAVAQDADRLARFEREAKLLAALNHAHIGAVFGLDEHDGVHFLAMELVEGETLEKKLKAGPLPVEDALRLALQIAEALEAAHAKGVVHRDLKPANVMVTADGQVKVLDFGLAKAFSGNPIEASPAHSPALSLAMTQAGLILGTAGYMSPEQASGQATDQRTDVWAFGVVLYEMLTGLPVFSGESVPHILADVLRSEPNWSRLPRNLHPRIRQLLERCLEKRPRSRYHSIADARVDIEQALSDPRGATPMPAAAAGRSSGWRAVPVGAALLAGVVLAGAAAWVLKPAPPVAPATQRLSVNVPPERPVVIAGFPSRTLALSPDGRQLVFVSADRNTLGDTSRASPLQLARRTLDDLAVADLPGTADGVQPFFSPDGAWLGFFTTTGELKKVSLAGGGPITLAENINGSMWAFGVWAPDDTIVFGTVGSGLRRVSAEGGEVTEFTTPNVGAGELFHSLPALVPGSDAVLFTVFTEGRLRIEAVVPGSPEYRLVVDNARTPLALASGHLLFQRDESVLIAPFDAGSLALTGPAVPLLDAVQHDSPGSFSVAQVAASRNGTLAYVPAVAAAETLGLVGRDGTFEELALPAGDYSLPRVSPDGRALAFLENRGQESEAWAYDLERGTKTRLGASGRNWALAWHPSGRSLALSYATEEERVAIHLVELGGSERVLVRPPSPGAILRNLTWSPDGMQLAYTLQIGSLHDIWIYGMADASIEPFADAIASEHSPRFSPDGRWLAYVSDETGQPQIYVQAFPRGERYQVSIDSGQGPVWGPDGTELFFLGRVGNEGTLMAVTVTPDGDTLQFGRPAALFPTWEIGPAGPTPLYETGNNIGTGFDVLADGQRLVMIRSSGAGFWREIVLVQNVLEEMERRAPTAR